MTEGADDDRKRPASKYENVVAKDRVLAVGAEAGGQRLDVFLAGALEISRAQVRRLLARGGCSLGDRPLSETDKGMTLSAATELTVRAFRPPADQLPRPDAPDLGPPIRVLARGEGWVVVDKTAGMPVHPLREDETGTVLNVLIAEHPELAGIGEGGLRSGVVHRLDVWTSGALVVATEQAAWTRLRTAFAEHRVAKRYLALVEGDFDATLQAGLEMKLGLVMARHRPARVRVVADHEREGRAVRHVEQTVRLVESLGGASLVEVLPRTGHLHQIRVTLAHIGHPVIGDLTYGPKDSKWSERCQVSHHMLHAAEVAVDELHAEAPLPTEFERCLDRLRVCDESPD